MIHSKALSRTPLGGIIAAAALSAALMAGATATPANAYAAEASSDLSATALTTQSNGMINKVSESPYDYGTITLSDPYAIPSWQVESEIEEKYDKQIDSLRDQRDADKITWEQYTAKLDALNKQRDAEIKSYSDRVERTVYDGWSVDKLIAQMNRNRANSDPALPALTPDQINKLKATDEWVDFGNNDGASGIKDDIEEHATQTVPGVSYNETTNTLTLKNFKSNNTLTIRNAGNDFKISVSGNNEIGRISVVDDGNARKWNATKKEYVSVDKKADWGAGLTITGTGTLLVNKNKTNSTGISISTTNTAAKLVADTNVSLRVLGKGDSTAIDVYGTNLASLSSAISFKGFGAKPAVTFTTKNIAFPLYKAAYASDADDAAAGTYAIDPNDGDTGYTLRCADNAHIARVSKYHLDAATGKYVIDQWKVTPAKFESDADGGYDYETTGETIRVASSNGQPAGYPLTKLSDHAAVNSFSVADADVSQLGKKIAVGKTQYTGQKDGTVVLKKAQNKKSVTVAKAIKVNGKSYKVSGIAKKAFKSAKKCKTVNIKATGLTAKSVKGSLKGAKKVTTVKVPKKQKAAYKKIFTASNAGKKVSVK